MQLLLLLRWGRPRHHQRATRDSIESSRQFSVNKFHFLLPYFPVTAPCPTKLHSNRIIIIISMCRLLSSLSSRVSRLNPSPSVLDHQLHQPRIASFPCPAIPSLFPFTSLYFTSHRCSLIPLLAAGLVIRWRTSPLSSPKAIHRGPKID